MPKVQSPRQWRYLLSRVSPLSSAQKQKMIAERRAGVVRIKKGKRR